MTETTTIRGALIMPYPSALGPADEPLTIEWPEGHSYAAVATAFHGGAVLGTTATEDEVWAIYDQWPKADCKCGCRGIVTRDGLRLRRGGRTKPCQSAKTPGRTLRPSRKKLTQSLGLLQPINSRVSWALHRPIRRIAKSDGADRPSLLREN